MKMGVRPPRVGLQGQALNHCMLLRSKGVVVSNVEKAVKKNCQVSNEKMSVNEPRITHRNGFEMLSKRVLASNARINMDVTCLRSMWQSVYRWHDLITGFVMERGNLVGDDKGNSQVGQTIRKNTNTSIRGGATCSSEEETVMVLERRSCIIHSKFKHQP